MHFPVGFVYHDDETPWPKNADGTQEAKYVNIKNTHMYSKLISRNLRNSRKLLNSNIAIHRKLSSYLFCFSFPQIQIEIQRDEK